MRRSDREVTDANEICDIMRRCDCVSLALFDGDFPYVIPLSFGFEYENNRFTLYFHCARDGKKLDLIRKNPRAAFEMSCGREVLTADTACGYSTEFESVCGRGIISLVDDNDKISALRRFMRQYSDNEKLPFDEAVTARTTVLRLDVCDITAKRKKKSV